MTTQTNIDTLKAKYQKQLCEVTEDIRDHVGKYTNTPCEYLTVRQHREIYYRGQYNALIELERL